MKVTALAFRNLGRNYRRTLVTALSIACGFAAISLFAGYTKTVYRGLADQAIHGELLGHLTIVKKGLRRDGRLHPEKYLLNGDEIGRMIEIVHQSSPAAHVAPRLAISGLLSNGRVSTIFLAEGIAPADMEKLRGPRVRASGALSEKVSIGVTVARGLAEMLGLKENSDTSVLVSTVQGQANALDVSVIDTFSTGNASTEDKFMFMPLQLAQTLYDVQGRADRLTILLPDAAQTEQQRATLRLALAQAGFAVEVETWQELSAFYRQVKSLFDMIFSFLLSIVVAIIVMSITNAMSMSVIERTREIGTLRAIGVRRLGVVSLFVTEAFLLVSVACVAGLALTTLLSFGINASEIVYRPPNSTDEVPLLIGFDAAKVLVAGLLLSLLGVIAAYIPARRAAAQPIIDSLGHV